MKLHNLSVIFIVIAIPLILITSYYISLQIDTINMQTAYNTKLLDSTKEAIDAFEINTVEWNANYSETADSKRRDVMASINTFTTSFANNTGVGGSSKEMILAYMPAIAYTLYDGYYIYSPAETKVAVTDDNGVAVTMREELFKKDNEKIEGYKYHKDDEGKLLYKTKPEESSDGIYKVNSTDNINFTLNPDNAETEYKHILKPFATYSEKIDDIIINYTLDNYITIYGILPNGVDENGNEINEYVSKAGYLTDPNKIQGIKHNSISGIEFNGGAIKAGEELSEQIAYRNGTEIITGVFNYVYESEGNTKVYFENDQAFILGSDLERTFLSQDIVRYKKITVPKKNNNQWTQNEYYQNLYNGQWYKKENNQYKLGGTSLTNTLTDKKLDYSASNYCVESYIFSSWINNKLVKEKPELEAFLLANENNNPESKDSAFSDHKREIIKTVVEKNLNQSITSYSRNSAGEYRLPKLTETDWDQILTNVSIITFIQNIPIGMKYYNNYAIATSTVNKEYVDPDEIYLYENGNEYYHMPYCKELDKELGNDNLIGYRSIDFVQRSYTQEGHIGEEKKTSNYFKHKSEDKNVNQADYYCLVQKSLYEKAETNNKRKAYYTALAREKYVARRAKLPAEVEPAYFINVSTDPEGIGKIFVDNNGTIQDGVGRKTVPIKKSDVGTTYSISGENNNIDASGLNTVEASSTGFGNIKDVDKALPSTMSTYTTDDSIKVTILNYNNDGVRVSWSDVKDAEYGAGDFDDFNNGTDISSELGTGYANAKLHYKSNFNTKNPSPAEVWANIDAYNQLTIVTRPIGVTGLVRLRFKYSNDEIYYSKDIFNVNEGDSIYCKIPGTSWYEKDCEVSILNVGNSEILGCSNTVSYYTIRDATGLEDFAEAVNGTKGSSSGAKTSDRTFKLIEDISGVGQMAPIAGKDGKWFDGIFDGQGKTISGTTISSTTDYNCFGLFGWVGQPALIKDLIIDGIQVNSPGGDYKAGGLAGFCDVGKTINNVILKNSTITGTTYAGGIVGESKKEIANCIVNSTNIENTSQSSDTNIYAGGIVGKSIEYIDNCNVQNSIIKGTTYAGGIVGESKKEIANCYINNTNVNSKGTNINQNVSIYVGGIAGKTENIIKNSSVKGTSQIGNGNIGVSKESATLFNRDCNSYYVGGITGYTNNNIQKGTDSLVGDNCKVIGGEILVNNSHDDEGATYTGGIIGYKDSSQTVDGNFSTKCAVSGHDNVGGIIGFNVGGNITNIINSRTIYGSGENIGGIVGYNSGGNISNCTNNGSIQGTGKNVGGIVGCNYSKDITNCSNNSAVSGARNVGGIAGVTYGGIINSCKNINNGKITGNSNKVFQNPLKPENWLIWYNIYGEDATGTGGIVGKLYNGTISCSYNSCNVECNYNGGGVAGLNSGGTIKYCFNEGLVKTTGDNNRLGGICGAGLGITIQSCYNKGTIEGKAGIGPLSSPVGGIIGFLVDNGESLNLTKIKNKWGNIEIDIPKLGIGTQESEISYCYNTGTLTGGEYGLVSYKAGIVGYKATAIRILSEEQISSIWDSIVNFITSGEINWDEIEKKVITKANIVNNIYLSDKSSHAIRAYDGDKTDGKKSSGEMKKELYNRAENSALLYNSKYIWNTTAPVETEKGYKGYGILWWQLDGYQRTSFHVYDNVGTPIYEPTLYINTYSEKLESIKYECSKRNITTYGYIIMLKNNETYKAKATNPNYTEEAGQEINVKVGNENDVYIGKRPEFILGINSNIENGSIIKENINIPNGQYYIIATGGGGSGPAEQGGGKIGGSSGAAFVGKVNLNATEGTKYYCEIGGHGQVSSANGNPGKDTIIKKGNTVILRVGGGAEGGPTWGIGKTNGQGGNVEVNENFNNDIVETYLKSNGYNGYVEGTLGSNAIGANSVLNNSNTSSTLKYGIGKGDRGKGGSNTEFFNSGEDKAGIGGCLYILSTGTYCICNIKVPTNSKVEISVTGDDKTNPVDYIIGQETNGIAVDKINGFGNQSFIVRKGATVSYTVEKDHYNKREGTVTIGNNVNGDNEETINVELTRKVLKQTITNSQGGDIKITGKFKNADGSDKSNSLTGKGSITFYVFSGDGNVNYTVSKTYYDKKNGSFNVTTNDKTQNVSMYKTKYYSNHQEFTVTQGNVGLKAKWDAKTTLNGSSDSVLRLRQKGETGTITLTFDGDTKNTNNWNLYIKGYKVGTDAKNSKMEITIKDKSGNVIKNETLSFADKDKSYYTTYTFDNKSIKTVTIVFKTTSGTDKRFWISSVYAETGN